jgi:hypothetical protein
VGSSTSCEPCEPGKFAGLDGSVSCVACPDGTEPDTAKTACTSCENGQYSSAEPRQWYGVGLDPSVAGCTDGCQPSVPATASGSEVKRKLLPASPSGCTRCPLSFVPVRLTYAPVAQCLRANPADASEGKTWGACLGVKGATCNGVAWGGVQTQTECEESAGTCAGATCNGAAWTGSQAECEGREGGGAYANPGAPGTVTKTRWNEVSGTFGDLRGGGFTWAGSWIFLYERRYHADIYPIWTLPEFFDTRNSSRRT